MIPCETHKRPNKFEISSHLDEGQAQVMNEICLCVSENMQQQSKASHRIDMVVCSKNKYCFNGGGVDFFFFPEV